MCGADLSAMERIERLEAQVASLQLKCQTLDYFVERLVLGVTDEPDEAEPDKTEATGDPSEHSA